MLVEKGRLAGEQSSRNWGFCRTQGRDQAEVPLALVGSGEYLAVMAGVEGALIEGRPPRFSAHSRIVS